MDAVSVSEESTCTCCPNQLNSFLHQFFVRGRDKELKAHGDLRKADRQEEEERQDRRAKKGKKIKRILETREEVRIILK